MNEKGMLYLCATPIGNLEDITLRVLRILREVDLIVAEDTRQTIKLLNHFEINKPLTSYHEHNKIEKGKYIVEQLKQGKNVALVSDAGTPAVSDPGEDLVALCIENEIGITSLPGPVAAITGLIISGLPTGRFCFEGFLTVNKRNRKEHLEGVRDDTRTLIFYEAPHKLNNTLKDMLEVFGDRRIALARELTKRYEEVFRGTITQAIDRFEENLPKGEFVVIIEGADKEKIKAEQQQQWEEMSVQDHIDLYVNQGMDRKEVLRKVAKDRGVSKREIYALQLESKKENK
ncbi:16S rRNA (cytidine(1402)-2'-O)-methyltransferase [Petroclostridium sp. X23]|uniref:16S rRNA (cytidine(1402)-2'-O)-methyltransferase n=1 Tax=Petroclostridium sp. X23 TaxID=3045146 RepID=UPI0024AE6954|nr:16S rRNA (cytidine(1402)-2'-O)-methyltransferase [Petroclostridium sp. X23]WHH57064.1 16S rRNA (cytidine(1402)-2'-O)-methyltransferase [Petroclostridium sp. X23]